MSWLKLTSGMVLFFALTAPVFGQTSEPGTHGDMMGSGMMRGGMMGRDEPVK
jgi:hypothetical protein